MDENQTVFIILGSKRDCIFSQVKLMVSEVSNLETSAWQQLSIRRLNSRIYFESG